MKIIVGKFEFESNAHSGMKSDLDHIKLAFNDEVIKRLLLKNVQIDPDIELIPTIYADGGNTGIMRKGAFDYIEGTICRIIKENLKDLDGIFMHLHGAGYVEEIGSSEMHIVKEIRKIVGPYMPIAITCDPHGNLTKEYVENCTIIRSYRHSPHTDVQQTIDTVFHMLVDLIRQRKNVKPIYCKLPLILGGEQTASHDEPVASFNQFMDEMEKDERILSASWHVGYLRHDCPEAGCGLVVIPSDEKYREFAQEKMKQLYDLVWSKRHEFHYTGITVSPEEALKMALEFEGDQPVFISDSGDSVCSGGEGLSNYVLKQFLAVKDLKKRVLFAAINDAKTCHQLWPMEDGSEAKISLGAGKTYLSEPVELDVIVKHHGQQGAYKGYGGDGTYGPIVTVNIKNTPIDVAIVDNNHAFIELHQMDACGESWRNYDIHIVKQGYLHNEQVEVAGLVIMSLTDGDTLQDTKRIPFKLIMRPMYPIDNI